MIILRLFLFFPDLSLIILIKSILIKNKACKCDHSYKSQGLLCLHVVTLHAMIAVRFRQQVEPRRVTHGTTVKGKSDLQDKKKSVKEGGGGFFYEQLKK